MFNRFISAKGGEILFLMGTSLSEMTLEGGTIINEAGVDVDFRVEAVGQTHALFVRGSDGFVGIRTAAPYGSEKFAVNGDATIYNTTDTTLLLKNSANEFSVTNSGTNTTVIQDSGAYGFALQTSNATYALILGTNSAERLRIDPTGWVGINKTTPYGTEKLGVNGAAYINGGLGVNQTQRTVANYGSFAVGGTTGSFFDLYANSIRSLTCQATASEVSIQGVTNVPMSFLTNSAERMRIDSSGNVLVGATTTGSVTGATVNGTYFNVNGARYSAYASTSNLSHNEFYNPNGLVGSIKTSGSATVFGTSSDRRLKKNIVNAPSAIADLKAIKVRSFDWKADDEHKTYGMIAQELQVVLPGAVAKGETEEDMMGVDYGKLTPILTKALQEALRKIEILETKMETLCQ